MIGDQPELTAESLEIGSNLPYCWRNLFSCVNLLRILNKLTKWKHSRIMVKTLTKKMALHVSSSFLMAQSPLSHCQPDAGRFQIGADPEEDLESQTCPPAAVRVEITQDADQISGPTVAQIQHEDDERHLSESAPPAQRRLGVRQRLVRVPHSIQSLCLSFPFFIFYLPFIWCSLFRDRSGCQTLGFSSRGMRPPVGCRPLQQPALRQELIRLCGN